VRQLQHAQFFAAFDGGESLDHGVRRVRKIGIEGLEILEGRFRQQQCRCHFQRHRLVVPRWVATQAVGDVEDGSGQSPIVRLTGGGTFLGDLGGTFVEGR
jgi:hypothetical protein